MKFLKSFAGRLNFYVLSLTAFFFLCLGVIFYLHISRKETDNARRMTASQVENISLKLELELKLIQDAIEKTSLKIFEARSEPNKISDIIKEMVSKTDTIYGGGVAFVPGYFTGDEGLFMEYAYWKNDTTFVSKRLDTEELNYLERDWYTNTLDSQKGSWSTPYESSGEEFSVMISYTDPVIDENGEIIAVVLADLTLKDLTSDLKKMSPYEDNVSFIINQDGTYISHPDSTYIMERSIFSESAPELQKLGKKIIENGKGTDIIKIDGKRYLASYSEIDTLDCMVCCITPYSSILKDLGRLTFYVLLVLCIVLVCLMLSIHFIVKRESAPVDVMEQDLMVARKIQKKMLPDNSEVSSITDRVDVNAYLRPARNVGGDLYDYFVDREKLFFAVGDVSGKGVPAALIMALTKSFFRSCSKGKEKAEDIVSSMNASILENDISDMFITLFVGIIDLKNHNLSYCNAGHEPPVIFPGKKEPSFLKDGGNIPVGIMKDYDFSGNSISFMPDDKIIIYTDGVTEAENGQGEHLGNERVLEIMKNNMETSAQITIDSLLSLIDDHTGKGAQSDDITMMCIKLIR